MMDGMRIELGYTLLAEAGDTDDQQTEEAQEPSYEVDFLAEEDQPQNIQIMDADIHEALHAAEKNRKIEFVRHEVLNRYWRPGRNLTRFVGQAQRVEISTSEPKTGLPDEPKSYIGKRLRAEAAVAESQARRPANNKTGLVRW
jgi:hypothetical protein